MKTEECNWATYLPVPFIMMDHNMDLVKASRSIFPLFRISAPDSQNAEGLSELTSYLLSKPDFVSAVGEVTLRLSTPGSRDRVRWIDGDRVFDIDISAMPPKEEPIFGLHFNDVTQIIAVEQGLEYLRNYLEQMIDNLPLGIVVVDKNETITTMNRVQEEYILLGNNPASRLTTIGSNIYEVLPTHKHPPWVEGHAGAKFHNEYTLPDGEKNRTFSIEIIPFLGAQEERIGAMHITEEITERLQLQADSQAAEVLSARLETLKKTAGTLNRGINNKLMSIMCSIQVVSSGEHTLPEKKTKLLEEAMDEAEIIAQFIRDLANLKEIKPADYAQAEKMINIQRK